MLPLRVFSSTDKNLSRHGLLSRSLGVTSGVRLRVCLSFAPMHRSREGRHASGESEHPTRENVNPWARVELQPKDAGKRPWQTWARQEEHVK